MSLTMMDDQLVPQHQGITSLNVTNEKHVSLLSNYSTFIKNDISILSAKIKENNIVLQRKELMNFMYLEVGIALLFWIMTIIYFPAKPPYPPSVSASTTRENYLVGLKKVICLRQFWLVGLPYSLNAIYFGYIALLPALLDPLHIDETDSGNLGFYCAIASLSGILMAAFTDKFSKHMKITFITVYICALICLYWFWLVYFGYVKDTAGHTQLYVSFILASGFQQGMTPLYYEMACECAYPIAEGITTGMLTMLFNVVTAVFFVIPSIPGADYDISTWMTWCLLISTAVSLIPFVLLNEKYGRLDLDVASGAAAEGLTNVESSSSPTTTINAGDGMAAILQTPSRSMDASIPSYDDHVGSRDVWKNDNDEKHVRKTSGSNENVTV